MIPIQAIALIYAGMMIESPERRKQFMTFINSSGANIEKTINNLTSKGGVANDDEAAAEESTEFR